jgi:undecaprenyl diphosphate synthase
MDKITLPPGTKIPNHIALLPDGDRRWARSKGVLATEGHRAGYEAIQKVIRASRDLGVNTFTIWGFSTENWERAEDERENIMNLVRQMVKDLEKEADKEGVRFYHLGRKDRLSKDVVDLLQDLEEKTKKNTKFNLNAAIDYGGRDEILRAFKKVINDNISPEVLDEKLFTSYLDTRDQPYPYPDLFIRTSGEQRDSGLMPWQMAYTEYYWEQDNLPDFTPEKLREAILDYSRRRRRFGGNDAEEHFKFDPKIVANLELQWRHALSLRQDEKFRDLVIRYVREHYGLSKELAKTAGIELARALVYGRHENWDKARQSLEGLYEIVRKTLGLALEPKIVANIEIDLWKNGVTEEKLKNLLAEKFRVSSFQAAKSAHLGWLASTSDDGNKKGLLEKFYQAIKERVA